MPTAAWEEARCMHGNVICFNVYCRYRVVNRPRTDSDLTELEERNRDSCEHSQLADAFTREEFEAALADVPAGSVKYMLSKICPECQRQVPIHDTSNQAADAQRSAYS